MTRPAFLDDLERDGFVVVPHVIPAEACDAFVEQGWAWLESFPHGFQRDDKQTWTDEHLPSNFKGGLYNRYSVNHEAFVWNIRTQPGILNVFEKIWGTNDLIASFDGINIALPVNPTTGRTDIGPTTPWPHMDQNPRRIGQLDLYQGIANLSPNGPNDGGLVVLSGSHKLHQQHFDAIGGFRADKDAGLGENGYDFYGQDADWYRQQGCEEIKICAAKGDLIIWDSRTIHWNASPTAAQTRFISYVCYCPRRFMDAEGLERKLEVFKARKGTTHWPQMNIVPSDNLNDYGAVPRRPDDSVDPANRDRPFVEPEETPEVLRLVGVRA